METKPKKEAKTKRKVREKYLRLKKTENLTETLQVLPSHPRSDIGRVPALLHNFQKKEDKKEARLSYHRVFLLTYPHRHRNERIHQGRCLRDRSPTHQ